MSARWQDIISEDGFDWVCMRNAEHSRSIPTVRYRPRRRRSYLKHRLPPRLLEKYRNALPRPEALPEYALNRRGSPIGCLDNNERHGFDHDVRLPDRRAVPPHHLPDLLHSASLKPLVAWSKEPGLRPRVAPGNDRGRGFDRLSEKGIGGITQDRDADVRSSDTAELARSSYRPA